MQMKKTIYILAALFLMSCSGSNEGPEIPDAYVAPFTLSADKQEVEADGVSVVTFSLKDNYGRELLDDRSVMPYISISSAGGIKVPRLSRTVSFLDNGEFEFVARYDGKESANKVTVRSVNRGSYEMFHKNIGIFKCTSVNCPACPGLVQSFRTISDYSRSHCVLLAFHGHFTGTDPFAEVSGSLSGYIMSEFGLDVWPSGVFDMRDPFKGAISSSDMEKNIESLRIGNPATCGIKVNSITSDGNNVKVNASLKSSKGGEYDLACALVADGLRYEGGNSYQDSGIYDEVVLAASDNFMRYDRDRLTSVTAGGEMTSDIIMTFSGQVSENDLNGKYIAVWAYRKTDDGGSVMDNIVTCSFGSTTEYVLNE